MGSGFENTALVETEDLVGLGDGRETVSDDEGGAALCELLERGLDMLFGARVERGSGFVEENDFRVLEDGACNCDALFFTTREPESALADFSFICVGEAHDFVVDAGGAAGIEDHFVGGVRVGVFQIVHDRFVKEDSVLRDDANVLAERVDSDVTHVLAVDLDGALLDVVETEEEPEDGCLAAAALADKGGRGAGLAEEVEPTERRLAVVVREVHIAEYDLPGAREHLFGLG